MIFPKYIKKNDIIAVTAPSNGITDEIKIKRFNKGVEQLKNRGYNVEFTDSVFKADKRGVKPKAPFPAPPQKMADFQFNRHAVGTAQLLCIVFKMAGPGPGFQIVERKFRFLHCARLLFSPHSLSSAGKKGKGLAMAKKLLLEEVHPQYDIGRHP